MNEEGLKQLIKEGEGFDLEFKQGYSENLGREMCAFANAAGGKIRIGVSDSGDITGFKATNKVRSEIQDTARNADPSIKIRLEEIAGVLAVHVLEAVEKPCAYSGKFFIREGSNTQQLNRAEIQEFFQKQGKLSYEEMTVKEFTANQLDSKKLDDFLSKARITKTIPEDELMRNLGLTNEKGEFKNAAILLFAKETGIYLPQSRITCVLYKGTDKTFIIDRKDFTSDIVANYNEATAFLYKNLRLKYEIKGFGPRKEVLEIPEDALKEAVINAVCHRDYSEKGACIQIDVFDDRVEISNPGGLIFKESEFGKRSLSRNPLIFGLLQRADLVEQVGSGISRMKNALAASSLPEPLFEFGKFFAVTIKRHDWTKETDSATQKIIELIKEKPNITRQELAEKSGVTADNIKFHLTKLKQKGIIKRIGPDKGGSWQVQ